MTLEQIGSQLRVGQQVRGCDGQALGTITEVWADVGVGEAWGAIGAQPVDGTAGADAAEFAFNEAMPGEGESYFRLRASSGDLYVPMSYVQDVSDATVELSVAASDVAAMQWDIRPDFLANRSVPDSGAPSDQA